MIRALKNRLARETRGTATVELALATPVLLTMALAGIDVALGFVHKLQVQQYAQIGGDYVMSEMENVPLDAEVKLRVNEGSAVPVTDITVDTWTECNGVKVMSPTCVGQLTGATETKFMQIEVKKVYNPILNIPGYANYVKQFTSTGKVTLQVK
ncbi:pilus assembly protein [Qipengyuania sp. 6B39]|uniref:TadE/TadG family type IV pilus assembly protein n=1 Tax=Qipengyuania proteolytica TaxID=2867239 RepID=UPI001C89C160|nr:TadE/TadG family type IV pilus assembly protein [Qipengyuania proteolytica]MBX7496138.1 pilus assembly protein [Qipengyuania proteolytica]